MNSNYELTSPFGGIIMRPYDAISDVEYIANALLDPRTWSKGFSDSSSRIPTEMGDAVRLANERHEGINMFSVLDSQNGNRVVGTTGIVSWDYSNETVKIGRTLIHPDCWGKKYNHEIKLVFLDWLFASNVGRIECDVAPSNSNSIRSLERFGFTYEGVKRRAVRRSDGTWRDTAIFSMVVDEWDTKRSWIIEQLVDRNLQRFESTHSSLL